MHYNLLQLKIIFKLIIQNIFNFRIIHIINYLLLITKLTIMHNY